MATIMLDDVDKNTAAIAELRQLIQVEANEARVDRQTLATLINEHNLSHNSALRDLADIADALQRRIAALEHGLMYDGATEQPQADDQGRS